MSSDKIMAGCLEQLPLPRQTAVRVFFSSTFTDMSEERNLLMTDAVPELRNYCSKKGIDFEVVDMRWGVREDAYADHTTTDICMKHIESCQMTSLGTNFVLFVGDKYGSRPLPNSISVTEFRLFRRIASWMELKFDTVEKWYLLDTNSVPPVYHIQPITTLLPYFNNLNPANANRRIMHLQNWECEEKKMKRVFRKVAVVALSQGKISNLDCEKYFVSVTENEIEKGIFSYPKIRDRVIYFERTLININAEDKMAKRFLDLTAEGEIDEDARDLKDKLKNEKLPVFIPEDQTVKNTLSWTSKGIDPENDEHGRYLTMLCESFKTMMKKQIDIAVLAAAEKKIENLTMAEALLHLQFCVAKCHCFYGQEDFINTVYKMMNTVYRGKKQGEQNKSKSQSGEVETQDTANDEEKTDDNEEECNESEEDKELEEAMDEKEINNNEEKREDEEKNNDPNDGNDNESSDDGDEVNSKEKEFQMMKDGFRKMGDKAPTLGIGDLEDESGADPNRNAKQELTSFTVTEKVKYPFVIYGSPGCGKTSIMAKLAQIFKHIQPDAVVIIRFLGTTVESTDIRSLLTNLIKSIWVAYKINCPTDMDFNSDIIYLGQYLQALLWQVASAEKPLYIFLDSLDQLSPMEQAHGLAWLPTVLPVHCALLISTVPEDFGCLDSAMRVLPSKKLLIEVPALAVEAADKVISSVSNFKGRALTRPQRNFLIERFQECQNPLYLRLIINQALSWRSHQQVKDLILGSDTVHAINHFMMNMERNHGMVLISKVFGYLTAMKTGASHLELEDILSLDNEVLQNTYLFHLPPSPNCIRLPSSLLPSIMMDAKEYIIGENVKERNLFKWFHRLFREVATERYLNEESKQSLHRLTAQYFLGYWHNKNKPLALSKNKRGWYPNNTRNVPDQPLIYEDGSLNVRKLSELPHHLASAGMWREFHKEITTNVDWLVAKVKAFRVTELKADLMFMLNLRNTLSEEIQEDEEDQPPEEEKLEKNDKTGDENEEDKEKGDSNEEDKEKGDSNESEEDLFITENKKQPEDIPVESEEESVEPEYDTEEPEYVPDLQTAMRDLEILIDIITLGVDSIRQNPNNVAVQIICQLGKTRAVSPGMKKLVEDAYTWIQENNIPMLIPQDACMPPPGDMLQTTLNVDVHIMGEDRTHDYPVQHSKEDNLLYVVQQTSRQYDTLVVLDISQGGEKVMVEDMKGYVHSIRFNANERYLIVCLYSELSKYQPSFKYRLYERRRLAAYKLEKVAKSMDASSNGDIVAYADNNICYICSPKREDLTLDIVYRLHHQETITNILFSKDGYYLLTFLPGDGFKVWIPRRGESTATVAGENANRFSLQEQSGKIVHITPNHKLLQVMGEYKKREVVRICDLATGDVMHELQSPELKYAVNLMELDSEEEYLLVATEETSIVNGIKAKSAILWDLEDAKIISRVTSDSPFSAVKVLVHNDIIYIMAANCHHPIISVYSCGPKHRPLAGAKLIRQIESHARQVIQILLAVNENSAAGGDRLITVASDNSIKIWSLEQVLKPPPKTKKEDIGASVGVVLTKEGDAVYFATDKGYIIRQCVATGERSTLASDLGGPIHIMLLSKNGQFVIAAVGNIIYVYYIDAAELEYTLESCGQSRISCMAENNNVLIAGHSGMEGKGRIWDLSNGRVLKDVSFLYSFYKTAVNSRGTQFGVTMFEYPLMIDVFSAGEEEHNISMEQVDTMMSACSQLEFSPDTRMLASASNDGRVRIIDTESGRYLHTMAQRSSVSAILFTWDSKCLLTAGYRAVYIWNIGPDHEPEVKGQLQVKLSRHSNFITQIQLALQDRYLVTASLDKSVTVCNMKTRTTLCTFSYHCPISTIAVAPDLSCLAFVPERSPAIGLLKLNRSGQQILTGIPSVPVPPKVKKAQAVALSFSTQEPTLKTSVACIIL